MAYEESAKVSDAPTPRGWDEDRLITLGSVLKPIRKLAVQAMSKGDKKSIQAYHKVREIVMGAPAVDATPVAHGQWVVDEADSGEAGGYPAYIEFHCPVCNEPYSLESGEYNWFYGDDIPFKFCHECGTKMDLKEN